MPPEGVDMSKYSRHMKHALGLDIHDKRLTKLQVPGYSKFDFTRRPLDVWAIPLHEAAHDKIANTEYSIVDRLKQAIKGDGLPADYYSHVGVQRARDRGRTAIPFYLYFAKAPSAKNDGFFALKIYNVETQIRRLCILLRTSEFSQRGCNGRCTMFVAPFICALLFCRQG